MFELETFIDINSNELEKEEILKSKLIEVKDKIGKEIYQNIYDCLLSSCYFCGYYDLIIQTDVIKEIKIDNDQYLYVKNELNQILEGRIINTKGSELDKFDLNSDDDEYYDYENQGLTHFSLLDDYDYTFNSSYDGKFKNENENDAREYIDFSKFKLSFFRSFPWVIDYKWLIEKHL